MLKWFLSIALVFALAAAATAQSSYKIRPGDQLSVEVLEDNTMNRSILVLPDGSISFPLAGQIQAAGQTVSQLRATLISRLAPNFASPPTVFVGVSGLAQARPRGGSSSIEVFLMGEVVEPGRRQIRRGTTILQFMAESGGFTKFAAKKRIQLRRTNSSTGEIQTFRINYRNIERGLDVRTATAQLRNGDIIVVPERRLFE